MFVVGIRPVGAAVFADLLRVDLAVFRRKRQNLMSRRFDRPGFMLGDMTRIRA